MTEAAGGVCTRQEEYDLMRHVQVVAAVPGPRHPRAQAHRGGQEAD